MKNSRGNSAVGTPEIKFRNCRVTNNILRISIEYVEHKSNECGLQFENFVHTLF